MRWILFKVIAFVSAFVFVQGAILPWAISNTLIPLWGDIILVTLLVMMWLAAIDRIANHAIKSYRRSHEQLPE